MGVESLQKRYGMLLAYIGPTLLGVFVFSILPILYNVFLSFTNRNQFRFMPCPEGLTYDKCPSKGYVLVGLENYQRLLGDLIKPETLRALIWFGVLIVALYLVYRLVSRLLNERTTMNGNAWALTGVAGLGLLAWFTPLLRKPSHHCANRAISSS